MLNKEEFINSIFEIEDLSRFNELALSLFRYQAAHVEIYKEFLAAIHRTDSEVKKYTDIPHLPISFFKTHKVLASGAALQKTFRSSGTTGVNSSEHHVSHLNWYEKSFKHHFYQKFGPAENLVILALLPSYMERDDSSLVYMVSKLIHETNHEKSGFYLNNYQELIHQVEQLKKESKNVILFGVTFALLNCCEQFHGADWSHVTLIETGGMKGRRKEITRAELHSVLKASLNVKRIHSEYGMTELLSQAYSDSSIFRSPPWMKILIREVDDPFTHAKLKATGGINVMDLANVDSCAFIATDDLGKLHSHNQFEVLGRFDYSDTRGCNLLITK